MKIKELESLKSKTTMHIGGLARYYAELETKEDIEEAYKFAREKNTLLIVLGAGSNTVFADGNIEAFVVRIKAAGVSVNNNLAAVEAGKNLAQLINELANKGLDLSPLTGIPGTIGGAIFGNAGQGPKGVWLDSFIESVTVFEDGKWKTLTKEECGFAYRESKFKHPAALYRHAIGTSLPRYCAIIWSVELVIPMNNPEIIKNEIDRLLKKRISDQPHVRTAGSCFKAADDGTPAWKLIDKAGLRGFKAGGVRISDKHANFLINDNGGNFEDVMNIINVVKEKAPGIGGVEMRLIGNNGLPIA